MLIQVTASDNFKNASNDLNLTIYNQKVFYNALTNFKNIVLSFNSPFQIK